MKLGLIPEGKRNPLDPVGDPEGLVYDPDELAESCSTKLLCKDIATILERHYPGWLWGVGPDPRQGMLNIFSMRLSGQWGFRINMRQTPMDDPVTRTPLIIKAGGEILERFGQRRGRYNYEHYKTTEHFYIGSPMMDIKDKDKQLQRHYRDHSFDMAVKAGNIDLHVEDDPASGRRSIWVRPGVKPDA